ncbi:MAG: hypothetical protein AB7O24_16365 [Kofleriaceae bacterium]
MRTRALVVGALTVGGCGGNGGGGSDPADAALDSALDSMPVIVPPNTTRLGTVQAVHFTSGNSQAQAGFYEEPVDGPGCTWTYAGRCSLAVCDSNAGLIATSAGNIAFTIGSGSVTLVPDELARYTPSAAVPPIPPGTSVSVSSAGAAVGGFGAALIMPTPLDVTAPQNNATVDRSQPLAFSWSATQGLAYVNLSQTSVPDAPYPSIYVRTIRCEFPAELGAGNVPSELMSQLEPGTSNLIAYATALVVQAITAGDYAVKVRLLAIDTTMQLSVQ